MGDSYSEIVAERRIGTNRKKLKYNTVYDKDGRRDYYSNLDMDPDSKTIQIGRSSGKKKWQIQNIKDDVETKAEAEFGKHDYKTVMSDFNIDASVVFDIDSSPSKKTSAKKTPAKKTSAKKTPAKKKPAKKKPAKQKGGDHMEDYNMEGGGTKKKPSKKKSSKKKKSKKKKSKKKPSKKKSKK
jgi:hypothetical protein